MRLRYLLDTAVVSSPISKTPDRRIIEHLDKHAQECAIGAPVWQALTYGCRRLPRGKRRDALEVYLAEVVRPSFTILPYDEIAAAWHGQERARLESLGRPAPYVDGQIAAIAHAHGLVLVTMNVRDFLGFRDIEGTDWSRGRS